MTNNEHRTQAVRDALDLVNRTKAPTKRAQLIANLMMSSQLSQAEVDDFTRELRRRAGVQDVTLLPDTTWTVRESGVRPKDVAELESYPTSVLRNTLACSEDVAISWPSVTFHWGVMITFSWGGVRYVAHSADYQITETYMSS